MESLRIPLKGEVAALGKLARVDAVGGHTAYALVGHGAGLAGFALAGLADGAGAVAHGENVEALLAERVAEAANGGAVLGLGGEHLRGGGRAFRPGCRSPAGRRSSRRSCRSG